MPADRATAAAASYLLVFRRDSSSMVSLPRQGELLIGAGAAATLRLVDEGLAAAHLALTLSEEGEPLLRPIEGATALNGDPLTAPHVLTSGDVIEAGGLTLVFHDHPRRPRRRVLDLAALRQRLRDEGERVQRTGRSLAVLSVLLGETADTPRAVEAALNTTRSLDLVAWDRGAALVVVLLEMAEGAQVPAMRLLRALQSAAPSVRAGVAVCPADARDPDALLKSARDAARRAAPGEVAAVNEGATVLTVGGRALLALDPATQALMALARRLAPSDLPLLLTGETGVGKEILAQALHAWSPRHQRPMVAINCAAVTETLFESELFGHERGAFTGAVAAKPGLFERASGGTVFLDEVGECSAGAQAKLLRVLETKQVTRVGSVREQVVDVRVLAATNRPLEAEVAAGRFRQDLFFRLNAGTVVVPPLRDRPLDLPVLARHFLGEACARLGRPPMTLTAGALLRLAQYRWPGNARELKNLMEYVAATVDRPALAGADLPPKIAAVTFPSMGERPPASPTGAQQGPRSLGLYDEIHALEHTRIRQALEEAGGVRVRAAERLGIPLRTLVTKLKEHDIGIPSPRARRKARG